MAQTCSELIWLRKLVAELGFPVSTPFSMHCDNQETIHIASNLVFHERQKHVEIDFHFICENLLAREISTRYVCSINHLADVFTKALSRAALQNALSKLDLINIYTLA